MKRTSIENGGTLRLVKAFTNLLMEKEYSEISVKDIAEAAHLSRSSFYLFFENKNALAEYLCSAFLNEYTDIMIQSLKAEYSNEAELLIMKGFLFIDRNKKTILGLWSIKTKEFSPYLIMQDSIELIVKEWLKSNSKITVSNEENIDFYAKLYAANTIATVKWWLESKGQHTYHYIATAICNCHNKGLRSLLL